MRMSWCEVIYSAMAVAMATAYCLCAGCSTPTTERAVKYGKAADGTTYVTETTTKKDEGWWPTRNKSVTVRTNGFVGKITTAIDPSTGTPLPSVEAGKAGMDIDTMPVPDMDVLMEAFIEQMKVQGKLPENFGTWSETLNADKSLWGAELANFYYTRKGTGTFVVPSSISILYDLKGSLPQQGTATTSKQVK
jgi:hypothetical protein